VGLLQIIFFFFFFFFFLLFFKFFYCSYKPKPKPKLSTRVPVLVRDEMLLTVWRILENRNHGGGLRRTPRRALVRPRNRA
jgi:hypothetical protein